MIYEVFNKNVHFDFAKNALECNILISRSVNIYNIPFSKFLLNLLDLRVYFQL